MFLKSPFYFFSLKLAIIKIYIIKKWTPSNIFSGYFSKISEHIDSMRSVEYRIFLFHDGVPII